MLYTMHILAAAARYTGQESYQGVMRTLLHPGVAVMLEITISLYLFGSCVSYLVVVVEMMAATCWQVTNPGFMMRFWITTISSLLMIPGMVLKDISKYFERLGFGFGIFILEWGSF